ncbi:MAG: precorrin-6y C5,15-methyltransferase (decarboxylating) subunit CbiE [Chloroflexi bacterium]|nr:precorrin-6y C5,15-methyltransferase (decarboxylating) subunit CbiE [Chloroflexota bacterium]
MTKIIVLGVGPGDPDLLTLKARDALQEADVVAGFETVLGPVRRWIKGEIRSMRYRNQEEELDYVASQAREGKKCVVCAWGDVNFSARELVDRVRRRADEVELIPCVSSIQVACMRLGIVIEESIFITLHARAGYEASFEEAVGAIKLGRRNVVMLPRPFDIMPADIAKSLISDGIPESTEVSVLERLTLPDERIRQFTLSSLEAEVEDFSDLSILVFPNGR